MQSSEWTTELIIIAFVVSLALVVLGYLLAMVRQGRENMKLSTQLQQAEQALELANTLNQTQQDEIRKFDTTLHEKALSESRLEMQLTSAQATEQRLNEILAERKGELVSLQKKLEEVREQHTVLKTTLERKEEHFKEQMQQLSETRQSLTKEFENLANKIFEEKGKTFTYTSQVSIDTMLKPFREQIEGFQKRINEVHDASLQGNTSLNAE
ncbi:MAG: hypothetical protein ACRC5A_10085, partial [Enterobacteriaceae bacterium]